MHNWLEGGREQALKSAQRRQQSQQQRESTSGGAGVADERDGGQADVGNGRCRSAMYRRGTLAVNATLDGGMAITSAVSRLMIDESLVNERDDLDWVGIWH